MGKRIIVYPITPWRPNSGKTIHAAWFDIPKKGKDMIVGTDWIWLHFPKCGGSSAAELLTQNFAHDKATVFDRIDPEQVIWHENIPTRQQRDPHFRCEGKRIVTIARRLPDWILSRVHFEASRPPHHIATRAMIVKGEFHENHGSTNTCEDQFQYFNQPSVDFWVRLENMHQDFERFFAKPLTPLTERLNENNINYVKDRQFWITQDELRYLYRNNPGWAAMERKVYGNLLVDLD